MLGEACYTLRMETRRNTKQNNTQKILELAVLAGEILLRNGAEIFRVKETMIHILKAFGLREYDIFVLANGIFATAKQEEVAAVSLREIPIGDVHLGRIEAVNALSRELEQHSGPLRLPEWEAKLHACAALPGQKRAAQALACGVSSAGFCFLVGGGAADCAVAFAAGLCLQWFRMHIRPFKHSAFVTTIIGAALVTLVCVLLQFLGVGRYLDGMIAGAIITLVPGIVLTNSIRDFFHGDYLSGGTRLIHALLQAACIAVGVGAALHIWNFMGGLL